jgi:drug/metabolite transporter (DMT)-like permease
MPRNAADADLGSRKRVSAKGATALGACAILLWSTLASLTVLVGPVPPFQITAIAFAIGGSVMAIVAILRGRARLMMPTAASLGLGVYGFFLYHALYFAALKLAPPAEASLISALWALLTVLFSSLLPGHRLQPMHVLGAALGLAAATLLVWDKIGASAGDTRVIGYVLALCCAVVWSSYSVASRLLAAVPSETLAVSCLLTAVLAFASNLAFEGWVTPPGVISWLALIGLGLGPLGAAFLFWDIGMKKGDVSLLGVLAYGALIVSTALLVVLGFADATWRLAVACALMVLGAVTATRSRA